MWKKKLFLFFFSYCIYIIYGYICIYKYISIEYSAHIWDSFLRMFTLSNLMEGITIKTIDKNMMGIWFIISTRTVRIIYIMCAAFFFLVSAVRSLLPCRTHVCTNAIRAYGIYWIGMAWDIFDSGGYVLWFGQYAHALWAKRKRELSLCPHKNNNKLSSVVVVVVVSRKQGLALLDCFLCKSTDYGIPWPLKLKKRSEEKKKRKNTTTRFNR